MLNELLNGKATLEAPPPEVSPYRTEEVAEVSRSCVLCRQMFRTRVSSTTQYCMTCTIAGLEASTAAANRREREYEDAFRKSSSRGKVIAVSLGLAVTLLLVFVRYQMKKSALEDAALAAGYSSVEELERAVEKGVPTDEFSRRVGNLADAMCSCSDVNCARTVQAQVQNHLVQGSPSDELAERSVRHDLARLSSCQATLEAGGKPSRSY